MSTTSLPSYPIPLELGRIPSYHQEPRAEERRIAIALTQRCDGEGRSCTTEFAKLSRTRGMSLHLFNQAKGVAVPVYGMRASIEGTLQLSKTDGLSLIAIKVEGILKLKEVAEGGTSTTVLCDETVFLWRKGVDLSPCPSRLSFSIAMPTLYTDGRNTYALPPTFEAHLTGLPGFTANIEYQITAIAARMKLPKIGLLAGVGQTTVSTPFLYYPRTCPSSPLPSPMRELDSVPGLIEVPEWRSYEANIAARSTSSKSVTCRFYVPRSHVFCVNESIPFHINFASSAVALSALLFFLPATSHASSKSSVRVQLLRQTCVDVKDEYQTTGTNTELWRIVNIGEGTLQRSVDGPRWLTLSGEIVISSDVKVGSFKASGLWVRDFIVFSLTPPDILNGPIDDARIVIPVRLVTDRYSSDLQYSHVDPPGLEELPEHGHSLSTTS